MGEPTTSATDAELLARSASGDRDAFAAFVARHGAAVHRFTRALADQAADAEDAMQQTFLQAWQHGGQARVETGARPWLFTIARHALARLRRRRAAAPAGAEVSLEELGEAAGFADPAATPQRFAAAVEETAQLHEALACLPDGDREVLVLRDLEQLPGEQVAAVLGLGLEAMKSRLHRARLRLLVELRRRLPDGGEA